MLRPLRTLSLGVLAASTWTLSALGERLAARDIHPERELLITAPAVVDSEKANYPGSWSFGGLIDALVTPEGAGSTVREWLNTWNGPVTVNNLPVAPRREIYEKIIVPWQKRDGYQPGFAPPWEPRMANAPFRLLAIVNRMDLCAPRVAHSLEDVQELWRVQGREKEFAKLLAQATADAPPRAVPSSYGSFGRESTQNIDAGEGRLVFCAVDNEGKPLAGGWTVIFEYILRGRELREWAQAWHALGALETTDPAFLSELEKVTRSFTHPLSETQSTVTFGQLRSSEAAFGPGREFRQFDLASRTFSPSILTQTPSPAFNQKHSAEQRLLSNFLHVQDPLIRSGVHQVPSALHIPRRQGPTEQVQVLAGSAVIPPGEPNFHWQMGQQVSRDTRRIFSMNTCTGCHAGETGCAEGLHIQPREMGEEARISNFLRRDGVPLRVSDPDVTGSKVEYQEMNDRAAIFAALLEPRDRATITALRPVLRKRLERTH